MIKKIFNYFSFKKNKLKYRIFIILFVTLLSIYLIYKIYKKITQKNIYVGCLYSEKGVLGKAPYDNYKMLLESFKYAVNKYNCNINIIPIYKDLGDNLENFSKWVEECVKKYNIKYFFGCWRSSERRQVLPILEKYNARLFYPLQYEGLEASKNVYYFGACLNQQLIPGLKYIFDTFYYYQDVYIIGSDYSYPKLTSEVIDNFIKNTKDIFNKKLVFTQLFPLDETDFSSFINTLFTKNPNGAIIINLINGDSYYKFIKQFYEQYNLKFKNIDKKLLTNQDEILKYLKNPKVKDIINIYDRYPSISTSLFENNVSKEYYEYINNNYFVANFSSRIIIEDIYYMTVGYKNSDSDYDFLKKYIKKNGVIGDSQYCTFLSVLFFVIVIQNCIDNKLDINNTDLFDTFKEQSIISVAGEIVVRKNNHISKNIYILSFIKNKFEIVFDSYKSVLPGPYMNLSNKILFIDNSKEVLNIEDRIYN